MVARMQGKVPGQKQISGKLSNAIVDNSKIFEYDTYEDFPRTGKSRTIYIAREENALYRWDNEEQGYYKCSGNSEFDGKLDEIIDEKINEKFSDMIIIGGNANG